MQIWVLATAALLLVVSLGGAQYNPLGWVFQGDNPSNSQSAALATVDPNGNVTTLVDAGRWRAAQSYGLTMDIDNRTYVVPMYTKWLATTSLFCVDTKGTIVNTIAVLPPFSGYHAVWDVAIDQDGDYVALVTPFSQGTTIRAVVKIARGGTSWTTVYSGLPLRYPVGLTVDVESGDYIVLDGNASALWRIAPRGGSLTTLARLPQPPWVGYEVAQLAATGDYYVPAYTGSSSAGVLEVTRSGTVTTFVWQGAFPAVYGLEAGRSSPRFPRIALSMQTPNAGIFLVDLASRSATTLVQLPGYQWVFGVGQNRGRHVATQKRAVSQWAVPVSFPSEPGNGYLLALSFSGSRPGFPLPDGRHVSFNVDILTRLSLNGTLASIFKNNVGTLDMQGEAKAILDVSTLPPLAGIRVWIQALTLNPSTSSGISTVADPITLRL